MQHVKIAAYRLGESIRLKNLAAAYKGTIYSSCPTDILIKRNESSYIYVQHYGEVSFSDCDERTVADFITFTKQFTDNLSGNIIKEDFVIEINSGLKLHFGYNSMQVPELNADVVKIVLLNVSQSVVLDHFTDLAQKLLAETVTLTHQLEQTGKISTSKTELMKFIGKTLNIQNRITDNLYFLDAPDTVWEEEYLAEINTGLSRTFHLKTRFKEVDYTMKTIDSNLTIFAQLVQHRDANKLEWIIILLIFFEALHAVLSKYF